MWGKKATLWLIQRFVDCKYIVKNHTLFSLKQFMTSDLASDDPFTSESTLWLYEPVSGILLVIEGRVKLIEQLQW